MLVTMHLLGRFIYPRLPRFVIFFSCSFLTCPPPLFLFSFFFYDFSFSFSPQLHADLIQHLTMKSYINLAIVAVLFASLYGPVTRELKVLGAFRSASETTSSQSNPVHPIADTIHCEDLHYYQPAGQLFTACEDSIVPRFRWFPPLVNFDGPADTTGSIHVIDPQVCIP